MKNKDLVIEAIIRLLEHAKPELLEMIYHLLK